MSEPLTVPAGSVDYKETYDENYFNGKKSFFHQFGYGRFQRFYFNNIYKQIDSHVRRIGKGNVLDVGCAYGLMLQRFPDTYRKFGLDISEHAIGVARQRLPTASLTVGGAEESVPFKDSFDVVLLNDVLEHLERPKVALQIAHGSLQQGGILYITTPNLNAIRRKVYRYADRKEHHISLFTHADLAALLTSLGFTIIDNWTYMNFPFYHRFSSNVGVESAFICTK